MALLALAVLGPSAGLADARFGAEVAFEQRLFPRSPAFDDQATVTLSPSIVISPEWSWESRDRRWLVLVDAHARVDADDGRRSHVDARELGVAWQDAVGLGYLRVFAGWGQLFWGVTEVQHLVDVVNQTDAVEDVDGEDKLGQPMLWLSLDSDLGLVDLVLLPWYRPRPFSSFDARLRGPAPVSRDEAYDARAGRWRPGFAVRMARGVGAVDAGLHLFHGISRDAALQPLAGSSRVILVPTYGVLTQVGLDLQRTDPATLYKLEAVARNVDGTTSAALSAGVEHTLYGVGGGPSDVGLLVEVMLDSRDDAVPTVFDHDLFLGLRWARNDVAGTSLLGGPVIDLSTGESLLLLEGQRRLGDRWRIEADVRWFHATDAGSPLHGLRRDGHAALTVRRYL